MESLIDIISNNLITILATVIAAVTSYIGLALKKAYEKYVDTKTKKEIVDATVKYVEQICKTNEKCSKDKFEFAKNKAIEWLKSKGIKISDTEIEVLIESAVNSFNNSIKNS